MNNFLKKYKHAWVLLYGLIYLPSFFYLEKTITSDYHIIHVGLDDKIPFVEYFIIPYLLWFAFVTIVGIYIFFKDAIEFYRFILFAVIGMSIFLVISAIYPNGQDLRPTTFARDNIFIDLVKNLYQGDTPTNIFPSIHVYNSIAAFLAVRNSKHLKDKHFIQWSTFIMTVLISLSTVFLKQHSILDLFGAIALAIPANYLAYHVKWKWTQEDKK